jgi:hypothetical protein
MTNEERIDKMLHTLKGMQTNPNFRLHKFDVYEHPDLENANIIHEQYTTKRSGMFETEDEWYLIDNGEQKLLNEIIPDKTSLFEFKSSLLRTNYALGGVIFN